MSTLTKWAEGDSSSNPPVPTPREDTSCNDLAPSITLVALAGWTRRRMNLEPEGMIDVDLGDDWP